MSPWSPHSQNISSCWVSFIISTINRACEIMRTYLSDVTLITTLPEHLQLLGHLPIILVPVHNTSIWHRVDLVRHTVYQCRSQSLKELYHVSSCLYLCRQYRTNDWSFLGMTRFIVDWSFASFYYYRFISQVPVVVIHNKKYV
jgi:hypothetical protein